MKVIVKNDKNEIGKEIARSIVDAVKENPHIILGLATGSSPLPIYENIIKFAKEENVSFKDVKTFNLDEYVGLSNTNDQSYYYFMHQNLFKYLDIKEENIHFPSKENVDKYDEMIKNAGGIDIQILGIGGNGHIAFNEPNTDRNSLTHITKLSERTIKDNSRFFENINDVPKEAITMGLKTILCAKKIFLVATGKNKSEAIRKTLENKYDPNVPASILCEKEEAYIYLDKECNDNI